MFIVYCAMETEACKCRKHGDLTSLFLSTRKKSRIKINVKVVEVILLIQIGKYF
jgi:hypothetical protein